MTKLLDKTAIKNGRLIQIWNDKRPKFSNANRQYFAIWVEDEDGENERCLLFTENEIKNAGGRLAIIETSSKPEYEKTRRFHRSQGYELAGRIADFYAPGDARLIFKKRLR